MYKKIISLVVVIVFNFSVLEQNFILSESSKQNFLRTPASATSTDQLQANLSIQPIIDEIYNNGKEYAGKFLYDIITKLNVTGFDNIWPTSAYQLTDSPVSEVKSFGFKKEPQPVYYVKISDFNEKKPLLDIIVVYDQQGKISKIYLAIPADPALGSQNFVELDPELLSSFTVKHKSADALNLKNACESLKKGLELGVGDQKSISHLDELTFFNDRLSGNSFKFWHLYRQLNKDDLIEILQTNEGHLLVQLLKYSQELRTSAIDLTPKLSLSPSLVKLREGLNNGCGGMYNGGTIFCYNDLSSFPHELMHYIFGIFWAIEEHITSRKKTDASSKFSQEQIGAIKKIAELRGHFLKGNHFPLMKAILKEYKEDIARHYHPYTKFTKENLLLNEMTAYTVGALVKGESLISLGESSAVVTQEDGEFFKRLGILPDDYDCSKLPKQTKPDKSLKEQEEELMGIVARMFGIGIYWVKEVKEKNPYMEYFGLKLPEILAKFELKNPLLTETVLPSVVKLFLTKPNVIALPRELEAMRINPLFKIVEQSN